MLLRPEPITFPYELDDDMDDEPDEDDDLDEDDEDDDDEEEDDEDVETWQVGQKPLSR
jgi:hypothetical protein